MKIFKRLQRWVEALNRKRPWIKYVLVFLLGVFYVLFGSNYTLIDYYKLLGRSSEIEEDIQVLEPRFREDSIRLEELRHLGVEVEAIAREQYLMKAPGEQIFIIKPDTTKETKNE